MSDLLANPYKTGWGWYWRDEHGSVHGPYSDQMTALRGLLDHMVPPWWKRWWDNLKAFWHDT